jgi:hypothetical protein
VRDAFLPELIRENPGVSDVRVALRGPPGVSEAAASTATVNPFSVMPGIMPESSSSSSFVLGCLSGGRSETPTACFLHTFFFHSGKPPRAPTERSYSQSGAAHARKPGKRFRPRRVNNFGPTIRTKDDDEVTV